MNIVKLINFLVLGLIYYIVFYKKWKERSRSEFIVNTLMYIYITLVIYVTLMPITGPISVIIRGPNPYFLNSVNLEAFIDLKLGRIYAKREIILNIIMLVPFGFLYPIIRYLKDKKIGIIRTGLVSFLLSLTIECSQLLGVYLNSASRRTFDVTDLITNTIGGIVGYIFFILLRPIVKWIIKKIN